MDIPDFYQAILRWYRANDRQLPWRQIWQREKNPYHVWLSEIMLQQTLIKVVIPAYEKFCAEFPTIHDVARADEESVRLACRGLGYYRRFALFHKGAKQLAARHPFVWPKSYAQWMELPGIGDYTAAAIASIVNGEAVAVLDGNVERVFCRLFDIREPVGSPKLKKRLRIIAQEHMVGLSPGDYNQGMMELGQLVCTKGSPSCELCPVSASCLAFARGSQALAPAPKERADAVEVQLAILLPVDGEGNFGVLRRSSEARFLSGVEGFPTFWVNAQGVMIPMGFHLQTSLAKVTEKMRRIGVVQHNITHHKISAIVYQVDASLFADLRYVKPPELEAQLLSNLDRKALTKFMKGKR